MFLYFKYGEIHEQQQKWCHTFCILYSVHQPYKKKLKMNILTVVPATKPPGTVFKNGCRMNSIQ